MTIQLLESREPQAPEVDLGPVWIPSPSQRPAPARRIPPVPRPRSHWPGRLWIAAGLLLTAFCLFKGLSSPSSATRPISEVAVGSWVRAENPTGEQDFQFGTEVDAGTWRHLTLVAPKQDGSRAEVELLRPVSWVEAHAAVVGGTVEISVPECGIEGEADVLAIAPCPQIAPRPGAGFRVVTGRFVHHSARVIDLHVQGLDEPIGTTANHPFWSEDRQQFVRADQLEPGDRLRAFNGTPMVTAVYPRPGPQAVYNLEVQVDHTYHVASSGLLVHNNCLGDNLRKAGSYGDAGTDAHHIVARTHKGARPARTILRNHGIDIDDAMNGVWLPRNSVDSRARGTLHHEAGFALTRRTYLDEVNRRITIADSAGGRASVLRELQKIRHDLLNGTFPETRPNY